MHFSLLISFNNNTLLAVSQSSTPIVLAASQRRCNVNTICCMYSTLHADDV